MVTPVLDLHEGPARGPPAHRPCGLRSRSPDMMSLTRAFSKWFTPKSGQKHG